MRLMLRTWQNMPDEVRPNISDAVEWFLTTYGNAPDLYEQLERYIQRLRRESWPALEAIEVQLRIIERLTT